MKIPLSWLRELAPNDASFDELQAVLSELGLPVESVTAIGEDLTGVVVAKVLEIHAIEGADKIRRILVDTGEAEPTQVVCGAWNFDVGAIVPFATVGTVLPGDFKIGTRKMKGVESSGMICASDELGLPGGDHSGIMLLPDGLPLGADFSDAMGITPDVVIELEINANRPDAMSVVGVARDVAARLGVPLRRPEPVLDARGEADPITVEVLDTAACPRFTGRVVRDVKVGPSPAWLQQRLTLAGMRPINNVVDASNYVMLELGQPTHAYDLAKLQGRGIRVRMAREGETIVTLDEVERKVGPQDLLICDATDAPIGIAGIMGGASTEVDDTTTEVLLEAADFDPLTISWTSKRLALRSEASARFEKGIDAGGIDRAVARFVELLGETGAIATTTAADEGPGRPAVPPVRVRTGRVNALLGTELGDRRIKELLDPIGFATSVVEPGQLDVAIPTWRPDSATEIDVVEEVARMHGYSTIERTVPTSTLTGGLDPHQRDRRLVRQILAGAGASEAWTTTFLSEGELTRAGLDPADAVVVTNPLVADESRLRTSLLPGLVRSLAYNASHRELGVWLFEVGNVFTRPPAGQQLPDEREVVAVALGGGDATDAVSVWHVLAEGLLLRGVRLEAATAPGLHPTRTARLLVGDDPVGFVGEIDPGVLEAASVPERVGWIEVDLRALLRAPHGPDQMRSISRYPSSDVDLSFEVDVATPAGAVLRTMELAGESLLVEAALFDVYRGSSVAAGRRSLTYRVRFQAPDRTLTDDELGAARQRLIAAVEGAHPATLRG
jgi:phenylalanyl-tRNA synthetase beta chain